MTTIILKVRSYGGTYLASALGLRASCTCSEEAAAKRLATKLQAREGGEISGLYHTARGQWVLEIQQREEVAHA